MTKRRATIVKGPWTDSRIHSPLELYTVCQNYWSNIVAIRKLLLSARRTALSDETIWPGRCDSMVASLQEVNVPIRAFYTFLGKHKRILGNMHISRRPVMVALTQCVMLLDELTALITTFRENCGTSSRHNIVLLIDIQQKFDELLRGWKTMHRWVTIFLEQIETLTEKNMPVSPLQAKIILLQSK